jgi:hypothetical protein
MQMCRCLLILIGFTFLGINAFSQARSGIGLAFDVNQPFSNGDYHTGGGGDLQGSIALGDKWAIVPAIGLENMDGNGRPIYGPYGYVTRHIDDVGLIYTGIYGKYFFRNSFFAKAGPVLFVGANDEDIAAGGIGASFGAGYNLKTDRHSSFELSLNTDIVYLADSNGTIPIASLKLAYMFNFRGRD